MSLSPFSNGAYFTDADKLAEFAGLLPTQALPVLANRNLTGTALRKTLAVAELTVHQVHTYAAMHVMHGRTEEDQKAIITAAASRSPGAASTLSVFALPRVLLWLQQAATSRRRDASFKGASRTYNEFQGFHNADLLHAQSDQPGYLDALDAYGYTVTIAERANAAQTYDEFADLTEQIAQTTPHVGLAEKILLATVDVPDVVEVWAEHGGQLGALIGALDPRRPITPADLANLDLPVPFPAIVRARRLGSGEEVDAKLADIVDDFVTMAKGAIYEDVPLDRYRHQEILDRVTALGVEHRQVSITERLLTAAEISDEELENWRTIPVSAQLLSSLVRRATDDALDLITNLPTGQARVRAAREVPPEDVQDADGVRYVHFGSAYTLDSGAPYGARLVSTGLPEPQQWVALLGKGAQISLGLLPERIAEIAAEHAEKATAQGEDADWLALLGHA